MAVERLRMNTEIVRPPRWAEAILRLLLNSGDVEPVTGDLLEEYRESVYASRGRRRANAWFIRQVAGFAWRKSAVWGLLLGMIQIAGPFRMLFAQTEWFHTSIEPKIIAAAVFLLAGRQAWRANRLGGGVVIAFFIAIAGSMAMIGGFAFESARWDLAAGPLRSFGGHFDWRWLFITPGLLLPVSAVIGFAGGAAGKLLRVALKP